jgi:hypothetical protein
MMALDTTIGGTSADSYITRVEYVDYWAALGVYLSDGTEADQEANLRRAAQMIDRKFRFAGIQQYQHQALAWPRTTDILVDGWPVDPDTIPQDIRDAQAEVAYQIQLGFDPFPRLTAGAIKRESVAAGSVSKSVEYVGGGREIDRVVAIEGLLRPYIIGGGAGGSQVKLARG